MQGANGTFYGGDTPSDPNNIRFDNGPSDINVSQPLTLSFVYQPKIMEDNTLVKNILDDFQFSGAEIASGGEPIFLGVIGHDLLRATRVRAAMRTEAASTVAR